MAYCNEAFSRGGCQSECWTERAGAKQLFLETCGQNMPNNRHKCRKERLALDGLESCSTSSLTIA